jgi:hypothetical protein
MNFYFVFEGKTEEIVYKEWFSILVPQLTEVNYFDEVENDNYYQINDLGYPKCAQMIANAIQDINEIPKYDYLVLVTDADRLTVTEKKEEILKWIDLELVDKTFKSLPENCKFEVIVQNVCIETWFLGNRNFFVRHPQQNEILKQYIKYFDVSKNDPENLASEFIQDEKNGAEIFGYKTKALFHEGYLREIFKERNLSYKKSRPKEVQQEYYLQQVIARIKADVHHLQSFQVFLDFCSKIGCQPKPQYSLDQLLSQCDPNAPITESDRAWLDLKSVGQEL